MPFDRVDTCLTPTELSHIRVIPLPAKDANGTVQLDEQDWNYSSYVITPSSPDRGAHSGRPRGALSEVGSPGWVRFRQLRYVAAQSASLLSADLA